MQKKVNKVSFSLLLVKFFDKKTRYLVKVTKPEKYLLLDFGPR